MSSLPNNLLKRSQIRGYQTRVEDEIVDVPCAMLQVDMGLGKTVMTLSALRRLFDSFTLTRVLVIAPLLVAEETWPTEIETWEHTRVLTYEVITGDQTRRESRVTKAADIHIVNRENLTWLIDFWGDKWPYDAVVIDEISGFKNPSRKTKPTKKAVAEAAAEIERLENLGRKNPKVTAKTYPTRFGALCKVQHKLRWIVGLTGTPAPNGLIDLWSQYYLLDRGQRLGSTFKAFRDRWFDKDYMGYKYTPKAHAFDEIMAAVADITISMDSEDYLELPPRIDIPVKVRFPAKVMAAYKKFERTLLLEEHDIEAVNEGVLTGKLLQLANGSIYDENKQPIYIHALKLDALERIVEENPGQPILVAYSYQFDLPQIRKRFPKAKIITEEIDGQGKSAIKMWNAGKIEMLVVHPASAGHGLNLQHGGYIAVWYGLTWSLELYMQFNKRLHRSGQKADRVLIYHIIAEGTVDERVLETLAEKNTTQALVIKASALDYIPKKPRVESYIDGDWEELI